MVKNGADILLEVLQRLNIRYIFAVTGTDHVPIIEALAKKQSEGLKSPEMIIVPHENTAVSMAHGYYLATGEPQVVMVHTTPGTANAIGGLMNAINSMVPLILMAGKTPVLDHVRCGRSRIIHWPQESRDQAGILREYVKWDYEIKEAEQIPEILERAYSICMCSPRGPVYIVLPREKLCSEVKNKVKRKSTQPEVSSPQADPILLKKAIKILIQGESPLIITRYLGRNPESVQYLVELADLLGAKVIQYLEYLNFPTDHPLYLGTDPTPYLNESDTILLLDVDVPWIKSQVTLPQDVKVLHVDIDPLHIRIPTWNFPVDLAIHADTGISLPHMVRLVRESEIDRGKVEDRIYRIHKLHNKRKKKFLEDAKKSEKKKPISLVWLSYCLNTVFKDKTPVILSETASSRIEENLSLNEPGHYFGYPRFGFLGWSMGTALGFKMAEREKAIVAIVGDGSYYFNNPLSYHYVSSRYDIPVCVVVVNNGGWNATRRETKAVFPDGWAVKSKSFPGWELKQEFGFEEVAKVCGCYAERIEEPDQLIPVLKESMEILKEGKSVLLNVVCERVD